MAGNDLENTPGFIERLADGVAGLWVAASSFVGFVTNTTPPPVTMDQRDAYILRHKSFSMQTESVEGCKREAQTLAKAWEVQAGQTRTEAMVCSPNPTALDPVPNAQTVNLQVLRTGEEAPVATEIKPENTKPSVASTAPKR